MRARLALLVLLLFPALLVGAQERARSATEARTVHGDVTLTAIQEGTLVERLRAIRAVAAIDGAYRALRPLAPVAAGDDPDLAPAAAAAAWRIARDLELDLLLADEVDVEALRAGASAWSAIAADESARADLRQLAAFVADALSELGAPAALPSAG